MRRWKLFPKIFFILFILLVFVVVIAHIFIYQLSPRMLLEVSSTDQAAEMVTVTFAQEKIVMQAIQKALPVSLICCLLISVLCSLLFSRAIADPVKAISASTGRMMKLDPGAKCSVHSEDEIGVLARNVNELYSSLLSTIEHLEQEKEMVREMEQAKADFLRAASHELKTPVTALNATLENMILGVGKYQDYEACLPDCKEMVERLSGMIHEMLEASSWDFTAEAAEPVTVPELLEEICEPYQLIAAAHGISFSLRLPEQFQTMLPAGSFRKALSNILANAVAYTEPGKTVAVYMDGRSLIIENECVPISGEEVCRLFEPFYRPGFDRSRENGGNGLGLSIVDKLLGSMNITYTFAPMESPPGMCFTIHL